MCCVGSAIYTSRWRSDAVRVLGLIVDKSEDVGPSPTWLFHSGPCGADAAVQEVVAPKKVRQAAHQLGIAPPVTFGGRLEPATAKGFRAGIEDRRDAVRMPSGPAIRIDDLATALRRILDEVAIKHGAEVQLLGDYYWNVPTDAAFDMDTLPAEFTAGQLTDDTRSIRDFLEQPPDEPISIWHELAHVAGVLRGIEHLDRLTT